MNSTAPLPVRPAVVSPPASPPFLLRFALPEIYDPRFDAARALVVLRLLLLTAPILLLLDWPGWGLTWVLLLAGVGYGLILLAYARAVGGLGGVNVFRMPDAAAAKPYYILALAAAAALALSPVLHLFHFTLKTRITIGLAAAVGLLVVLFLARKVARPGLAGAIISQGGSPIDIAKNLENAI